MNIHMSARRTIQLGLVAAVAVVASDATLAQQTSDITVEAARPVKVVVGHSSNNASIEELSLTGHVTFADLDLRTRAGATELEKRVSDAARDLCGQLDKLNPLIKYDVAPPCVKQATDDAMVKARAAIAAADKRGQASEADTKK
jgi:UrcA family protein